MVFCCYCGANRGLISLSREPWCESCSGYLRVKQSLQLGFPLDPRSLFRFCAVCDFAYPEVQQVWHHCGVETLRAAEGLCHLTKPKTNPNPITLPRPLSPTPIFPSRVVIPIPPTTIITTTTTTTTTTHPSSAASEASESSSTPGPTSTSDSSPTLSPTTTKKKTTAVPPRDYPAILRPRSKSAPTLPLPKKRKIQYVPPPLPQGYWVWHY